MICKIKAREQFSTRIITDPTDPLNIKLSSFYLHPFIRSKSGLITCRTKAYHHPVARFFTRIPVKDGGFYNRTVFGLS